MKTKLMLTLLLSLMVLSALTGCAAVPDPWSDRDHALMARRHGCGLEDWDRKWTECRGRAHSIVGSAATPVMVYRGSPDDVLLDRGGSVWGRE